MKTSIGEVREEWGLDSVAANAAEDMPVKRSVGAFILALFEAVCVVYMSAAKAGYAIAAAAVASGAWATVLHRDIIRIPILTLSSAAALANIFLLWKAHR